MRHGIPETVRSDNGPQYSSVEFVRFASRYGFQHTTSSPHFPQSNGQAERAVQTVKNLLKQASDPYLALLSYCATPLTWCQLSPAELLMGRRLRTTVPQISRKMVPYLLRFRNDEKAYKQKQKKDYDTRYRVHEMPAIPDDTDVWITTDQNQPTRGRVTSPAEEPRSYVVDTPTGQVRRNCHQLNPIPDTSDMTTQPATFSPTLQQYPLPLPLMRESQRRLLFLLGGRPDLKTGLEYNFPRYLSWGL